MSYAQYTESELKKLHYFFGHPPASSLTNLLRWADPTAMSKEVREAVSELTKACIICSENASRPRRFNVTIGTDDLRLIRELQWILCIHTVDRHYMLYVV